ncbi:DUF389 domain-containing protein [Calothrix sp. UHCC 0171]|uniref:DUF389 domain-containing protein n=1 Tax=Calothrix sp. UHCC 0171 TaxID=3110245 RepID=UPI002B20982B|nr:DUF389 domain-containing protein [Calothrix sp. UHCC 0171]MEA5569979.1 DUF389 domain-containing protein [Calothrix sp. UHCC 0171]
MFREIVRSQTTLLLERIQIYCKRLFTKNVDASKLEKLQLELLEESHLSRSYVILILGSCIIATLGLIANSAAVIIGAMIVAPLMLPIRALAFGALEGDVILFRRGLISVAVGTLLAVILAWLLASLAAISLFGSEILARTKPTLIDLGIAIAAGGISGYAKIQPKISGSLAGTAIAVALMPPICVIGIGLANGNWSLSMGATLLYLTNLLGITLSCMAAFLATGYVKLSQARKALIWAIALTGILLIPLGLSFVDLVRQTRLEASLKQALLKRTITFQRVDLVKTETNWLVNPPEVRLTIRSQEKVTPKQVELLEEFVERAMGQPFRLIFDVSQVEEVRRKQTTTPR